MYKKFFDLRRTHDGHFISRAVRQDAVVIFGVDTALDAALHGEALEGWVKDGSFTVLGPLEVLKETELFLQHVDSEGTVFRANHASNYLTLKGTLNGDREALLAQIRAALEGRRDLKPEFLRAL